MSRASRGLLFGVGILLSVSVVTGAQTNTAAAPKYRIAGVVVSRTDGHPLARARVSIVNVKDKKDAFSIVTSDDGKFEFVGVSAGKYSLVGGKRGYLSGGLDQHEQFWTALVTGAGVDTENIVLRLWPAAYITGKVLDEAGDPVRQATVSLFRISHDEGVSQIEDGQGAATDDLGSFELGPQGPGTYFVAVQTTPWYAIHPVTRNQDGSRNNSAQVDSALDVAYPLTYYSDVTDPEAATPITLHGGDRTQIEIHMSPVQALHILFRSPEGANNGAWLPQLLNTGLGQDFRVPGEFVQQVSDGFFEITGVPPGRYTVRASDGTRQTEIKQMDLVSDGEELNSAGGAAFSNLKVSLQIRGGGPLPANLSVGVRRPHRQIEVYQPINSKGEAQLQNIAPGQYEVVAFASGKQYFIAQITSGDAQVSGHLVTVTAGTNISASVSLITGTETVHGFVRNGDKAIAGAMVVLVPKDPINNPDLFRRDQTDLDGSFQLNSVVPGSYTILAIQDGWDLDWSQPAAMTAYLKNGQPVEISDQRSFTLSQPVQVQAK